MRRVPYLLRFLQGVEELTILSPVRSESAIALQPRVKTCSAAALCGLVQT
jgi:hypothetical protein